MSKTEEQWSKLLVRLKEMNKALTKTHVARKRKIAPSVLSTHEEITYVNYTQNEVCVISISGIKQYIPPTKIYPEYTHHTGKFFVVHHVPETNEARLDILEGHNSSIYQEVIEAHRKDESEGAAPLSCVIYTLTNEDLCQDVKIGGTLIPELGKTVGFTINNPRNRAVFSSFLHEKGIKPAGLRFRLYTRDPSTTIYICYAGEILTVQSPESSCTKDKLEIYVTDESGETSLETIYGLKEVLDGDNASFKCFVKEVDAIEFTNKHNDAVERLDRALEDNVKLGETLDNLNKKYEKDTFELKTKNATLQRESRKKIEELETKLEEAKAEARLEAKLNKIKLDSEKSKNNTSWWTKLSAIVTAVGAVLVTILKFKTP